MIRSLDITLFGLLAMTSACRPDKTTKPDEGERACTKEAKVCPDGSSVGRTGPDCEFAACPGEEGDDGDVEPSTAEDDSADDETEAEQ